MEVIYASEKIKNQCCNLKSAKKLFGGNDILVRSLFARLNALSNAESLSDIIIQPHFGFHNLKNKQGRNLEGYFAIDVKTHNDPWRIILEPLDNDKKPYNPCLIDKIARVVKIIEIKEVSKHYE